MRNNKSISNTFNLIEIAINLNNKLYKKIIKKIQLTLEKSKYLL